MNNCPLLGCQVTSLVVTGAHNSKRTYKLNLPAQPAAPGGPPADTMQVLGGYTDDSVAELELSFKGQCKNKLTTCPSVSVKGGPVDATLTASPGKVKVYGADPATAESVLDNIIPYSFFMKNLLIPSNAPKMRYHIKTGGCSGHTSLSATVDAFVPVEWKGKFSVGWKQQKLKDNQTKFDPNGKKVEFSIEVAGKYDRRDFKVGGTWDKNAGGGTVIDAMFDLGGKILGWLGLFDRLEKKAMDLAKKKRPSYGSELMPNIDIEIKWPKFAVKGGVKNVELKNTYQVTTEGSIKLTADPLIGAEVSTDILDWVAAIWPMVSIIKKKLEEGVGNQTAGGEAVLTCILGIGGAVQGDIEITFNAQEWSVGSTVIEGRLSFKIKGGIYVEGRVWRVYAGAGAEFSLSSSDNADDEPAIVAYIQPKVENGKVKLDGNFSFNGITMYGAYYAHFGVASVQTKANSGGKTKGDDSDIEVEEQVKLEERKLDEIWKLAEPRIWIGK